jgi:hypothetical protein
MRRRENQETRSSQRDLDLRFYLRAELPDTYYYSYTEVGHRTPIPSGRRGRRRGWG